MGVFAVVMGIGSSYGLCALFGLTFTYMNTILPFLVLGIGIDNMFVIVQSFDNLEVGICKWDKIRYSVDFTNQIR